MSKTYECSICYGVNHVSKIHCSTCGTIPAMYSLSHAPARLVATDLGNMINGFISVVAAIGVDRTERHCYAKCYLRTVPADYYASKD